MPSGEKTGPKSKDSSSVRSVIERRAEIVEEDVGSPAAHGVEGDLGSVRREGRGQLLIDVRHLDALDDVAVQSVEEQQVAAPFPAREDRDAVAVVRHGEIDALLRTGRHPLGDEVLVCRLPALRQVLEELALARRHDDDVGVLVIRRDRRDEVAGRVGPRRELGRGRVLDLEPLAEVDRLALLRQDLQVLLAQVPPELDVEVFAGLVEGALDGALDARSDLVAVLEEEIAHRVLAPFGGDEVEHGVAEAVGEEAVDAALRDLGDAVREHGVAQDHPVLVVLVVAEVRGHALQEPLRRVGGHRADVVAVEQDLELEDVRELVRDELLQLLVRQVHRQHHPVAGGQREGADALGDEVQIGVGLLEVRVVGVVDEVDGLRDLEIELARDVVVGALGERGHLLQGRGFAVVVVDREVRGLVGLPVEAVVDDLVLAEGVLRVVEEDLSPGRGGQHGHSERQDESPHAWSASFRSVSC